MGFTRRLTLFLKRHNIDDWAAPRWIYHHAVQPILRRLYPEAVVAISGGPEEFQLRVFKALVHLGDVVVDLGANVGYYTLPAAEAVGPQGRVFAFEPEPSNCALMRRLTDKAGYANVTIVAKAATQQTGKLRLFLSGSTTVDHRIYDTPGRVSIEIDSVALDEYFSDFKGRIDVVKIDVQGAELSALLGMQRLLETHADIKLFTEFWPTGLVRCGNTPQSYLEFLARLGFSFLLVDEKAGRLREVSMEELLRDFRNPAEYDYANLLCVKDRSAIVGLVEAASGVRPRTIE